MALLATGVADPNWRTRKLASAGEALSLVFGNYQQRREQRRQQALDEIGRFWKIGQEMPEVAAGAYGQSLVRKYSKDFPEITALVETFAQRDALKRKIDRAGTRYLNVLGELEGDYDQQTAALNEMPDENFVPLYPGAGAMIPIPNIEKVFHQQRLAQVQPAMLPTVAAHRLTPEERAAARLNPTVKGMMPTEFDPFSNQLSEEAHLLYGALTGQLTGEMAEYARTETELQPSRADLQQQGFQRGERLGREVAEGVQREHQTREREAGAGAALNYIRESDRLARGREAIQTANQRGLVQLRHELGTTSQGKQKPLWQLALDENAAYVDDWDEGLRGYDDKDEYRAAHGRRPSKMPPAHARLIANSVAARVKAGELPDDEVVAETLAEAERYTRMTSQNVPPPVAIQRVLRGQGAPKWYELPGIETDSTGEAPRAGGARVTSATADPIAEAMRSVPKDARAGVQAEVQKQLKAKKSREQVAAWLREAFGGD